MVKWYKALHGAYAFMQALKDGDTATEWEMARRAKRCADCPHAVRNLPESSFIAAAGSAWTWFMSRSAGKFRGAFVSCGKYAETTLTPDNQKLCGCGVLAECIPTKDKPAHVTINGIPLRAALKAEVGSSTCLNWE
jgi:hypothetical protein